MEVRRRYKPSIPKPFRSLGHELLLPLTTIVSAKGSDGVVIACDSQGSMVREGRKVVTVNKIVPIGTASSNPLMAMAGSGDSDHISILAEALTKLVGNREFTDGTLREEVATLLIELHRKHNVERSAALGLREIQQFYDPDAVLAARLKEENGEGFAYRLYRLRPDGWITPVQKYQSIGSGSPFADFVIDAFDRQLGLLGTGATWSRVNVLFLKLYLPMVVNQIKFADMFSGGRTRVAIIDKDGFRELSDAELGEVQKQFFDIMQSHPQSVTEGMFSVFKDAMKG